jgi:hypothetical protein
VNYCGQSASLIARCTLAHADQIFTRAAVDLAEQGRSVCRGAGMVAEVDHNEKGGPRRGVASVGPTHEPHGGAHLGNDCRAPAAAIVSRPRECGGQGKGERTRPTRRKRFRERWSHRNLKGTLTTPGLFGVRP